MPCAVGGSASAGNREVAEPNIVLRCLVGSTAHGLALEGTDDRDEMAVCIEPPECVIGLRPFEQWVHRTAEERARHDGMADQRRHGRTPRSQAGDLDLVCYSLRKWARLARAGNPTVLLLLFAEPLEAARIGIRLQEAADIFASREAGQRFLGYLKAQRERLLGERGQMRVTRDELVEAHGYDSKFAMHALRLGYQGVEYLTTGRLALPMTGTPRDRCMAVRHGEVALADVVGMIEHLETELKGLVVSSHLPERPANDRIDRFLVDAYTEWWGRG